MANPSDRSGVLQLHLPERWPDLAQTTETTFRWTRYDSGQAEHGSGPLRTIQPALQTIAIVPSSRVLFARVRLPGGRAAKQDRVLAFAIEDTIGVAPEEIHAIHAADLEGGETLVAAVDRTWLKAAVGELDIQGFAPQRMLCEGELVAAKLSAGDSTWTVVRLDTGGFVHVGRGETISLDIPADTPGAVPLTLGLAAEERAAEGDPPLRIEVFSSAGLRPPETGAWTEALGIPVHAAGVWQPELVDARRLNRTNLLTGLAGRKSTGNGVLSRFKVAAALAAAILLGHAALMGYDWWRLNGESTELRAGMEARFKKIFPDTKAVVDPQRQLAQLTAQMRRDSGELATDDFLALLARVSPGLVAVNAQARSVGYDKGELRLEITIPPSETRESLATKLAAAGIRVQVERVTTEGTTATAMLKVVSG